MIHYHSLFHRFLLTENIRVPQSDSNQPSPMNNIDLQCIPVGLVVAHPGVMELWLKFIPSDKSWFWTCHSLISLFIPGYGFDGYLIKWLNIAVRLLDSLPNQMHTEFSKAFRICTDFFMHCLLYCRGNTVYSAREIQLIALPVALCIITGLYSFTGLESGVIFCLLSEKGANQHRRYFQPIYRYWSLYSTWHNKNGSENYKM